MDEQAKTAAGAASDVDGTDAPERDDGPRDSTRLNWLEAQTHVLVNEWYRPGVVVGKSERFFQLTDSDDEVIGEGADLRAAIDDAMGWTH